jgi:large subunit ribosomal protein L25
VVRGVSRKDRMEKFVLEAKKRDVIGKKVKALRREGLIPAIIYGREIEPIPISLITKDVTQTLKKVGANTLITLKMGKKEHLTLVRDIQRDVIKLDLLHMDFQAVSLEEKITSTVPIVVVGEAPVLADYESTLITSMEDVQIEAKAKDLPDTIEVDVSGLVEIGDNILVKDLVVAGEVTILDDPEENVIVAAAQTLMEIEVEVEEEAELLEELTDAELLDEEAEVAEEEETEDDTEE